MYAELQNVIKRMSVRHDEHWENASTVDEKRKKENREQHDPTGDTSNPNVLYYI